MGAKIYYENDLGFINDLQSPQDLQWPIFLEPPF